jgi:hypothetical protein
MGFGNQSIHVLQPLIDQAKSEQECLGRPLKKTLLELAERRVNNSWRPSQIFAHFSEEENKEAKQLLVENGLEHLTNCSPKGRAVTLILIEAEKQNLSDDVAEQLEVA